MYYSYMCSALFMESDQFSIDRLYCLYCANCYYFVFKKCDKIPNTRYENCKDFLFVSWPQTSFRRLHCAQVSFQREQVHKVALKLHNLNYE